MKIRFLIVIAVFTLFSSCVSLKKYNALKEDCNKKVNLLTEEKIRLQGLNQQLTTSIKYKDENISTLNAQIEDLKIYRNKQLEQVGELTVLSQQANENIKQTLDQLENKDKYIHLLQKARSKADSINLALAINLKSVLKDGIEDEDIDIKVDKTVVFINLSDKMLFQSGKSDLTEKAREVLGKIAKIVETRKDIEIMVEGYTDNVPINTTCIKDNWELSAMRAIAVVRVLQEQYNIDPNKLIAAGRGKYNALADNSTKEGRAKNRRTRIIIMPKLDQFYDLLNPNKIPK